METGIIVGSTMTLDQFQNEAFFNKPSPFAALSIAAGKSDSVMHIGTQLRTEEIVGHALTIIRVGMASLPATDPDSGEPIYEQNEDGSPACDENGEPIQKYTVFPVCHFKEAPGYWYNGGQLLKENIKEWADFCGDDLNTDPMLTNTNRQLQELGGVKAYFSWGESRRTGRKYVRMILA